MGSTRAGRHGDRAPVGGFRPPLLVSRRGTRHQDHGEPSRGEDAERGNCEVGSAGRADRLETAQTTAPRPTVCPGLPLSDLHPTPGLMPYPQLWYGRRISSSLPTPPCNFLSKTVGYCWPTYIKVLGVLCLGEVSSTFLPSKKACWAHQFQYLGVGQQYPVVCEPQRRALNFPQSWLRVFQRGNAAHLPHGVGQEREATLLQSEKYVARGGSKYDAMCMITASFVRLLQRCTDSLGMHFLLIFQEVRSVSKTRGGGRQKMANLAGKK